MRISSFASSSVRVVSGLMPVTRRSTGPKEPSTTGDTPPSFWMAKAASAIDWSGMVSLVNSPSVTSDAALP
ncbi:hypothetical protein D3C86_1348900 [compost metagenome]